MVRAAMLGFAATQMVLLPACSSEPAMTRIATALVPKLDAKVVVDTRDLDHRRYPEVSFASTHNSYSGELGGGNVASIREQLDRGVRMIELDFHDDSFDSEGFRVGHLRPGAEVYHGEDNPQSDALAEWLGLIARWSDANPKHAPITLALDIKDSIGDNTSFAEGDLVALNALLDQTFGKKLFRAAELETRAWPTIGELRGRVLVVLSGNESSRIAYRGDRGARPAVAMNDHGVVVEAHDTGDGHLAYWTGRYGDDGRIQWVRHAIYDTGKSPAIDVNDDGLVIEVHEDPDHNDDQLWYRLGKLDENLEIVWFHHDGLEFPGSDEGKRPSVRFVNKRSNEVREIHESPTTGRRWYWSGDFDPEQRQILWDRAGNGRTNEARFARSRVMSDGRVIEVFTGPDGAFGADTLLYTTDRVGPTRIRPEQLAFVELQHGSATQLENDGLLFYSGPAASMSARLWAAGWHAAGKVARLWSFNEPDLTIETSVNFPATDQPFSGWYDGYRAKLAAVR